MLNLEQLEHDLKVLKEWAQGTQWQDEFLTQEGHLHEILDQIRRYGDTPYAEQTKVEASLREIGAALEKDVWEHRHLITLTEILAERFDREELRTLCFRLDVDYDDLPAEGKINKARELVKYFARRDNIDALVTAGKQLRTDIDWAAALSLTRHPSLSQSPSGQLRSRNFLDVAAPVVAKTIQQLSEQPGAENVIYIRCNVIVGDVIQETKA